MGTLYIIGNGFDLNFNLNTRTEHFSRYLKKQSVYNEVGNALEILDCYGVDWHEYEQSLNDIDLDEIEYRNEIQSDYLSDRESDRDGGILNMQMYVDSLSNAINSALEQMVINANNDARKLSMMSHKRKLFQSGDAILTFNYTSTIEYLFYLPYDVPIFHIHGCYEHGTRLIFGYKSNKSSYGDAWASIDEEYWNYYVAQQRESVYGFYDRWRKSLQIDNLKVFLSKCYGIDRVIVLGHSMSAVDAEYMELVERHLHPRSWEISYHNPNSIDDIRSQGYSFGSKMRFATMKELINA